MTLLKRHLAPIEKGVWEFIEEEARTVLKQRLNGRKVVDIVGPMGKEYSAYNTGRSLSLDMNDESTRYYLRNILPLVEVEVPFSIKRDEVEAFLRGAKDVDIDNLVVAAKKLAKIENDALYYGLEAAGIEGLLAVSDQVKINISEETEFFSPISAAIQALKQEAVDGPYNFVVGPYLYSLLSTLDEHGYPLRKKVKELIEGEIIYSEELGDQGLLLSNRDDDFELIVGQDISIGYQGEINEEIEFFLTESFTFKVNAPEAIVVFAKP